jgi:hypothetical protein
MSTQNCQPKIRPKYFTNEDLNHYRTELFLEGCFAIKDKHHAAAWTSGGVTYKNQRLKKSSTFTQKDESEVFSTQLLAFSLLTLSQFIIAIVSELSA